MRESTPGSGSEPTPAASTPGNRPHAGTGATTPSERTSPWRAGTVLPVGAAILGAVVFGMSLGGEDSEDVPGADPGAVEVAVAGAGPAPVPAPAASPGEDDGARAADEAAILGILRDQYDALLDLDAQRYASHLHPDAVWENALGDRYEGRDQVLDFNARVAATMEGARYEGWDATVRFVTPEVAVADVTATLVGQQVGGRRLVDRPMLNVYVLRKDAGAWSVAHTRIRDRWVLTYAEP
jgi:uncharacterized protein (TIGR02246 family)